ncbi:MAG: hypothetical protein ABH813_00425 [Patescibacteria group bacterium]
MAINFSEKGNRQKYLIIFLIVIVLVTIFVLRKNIFKTPVFLSPAPEVFQPQSIEINFEVFKSPILEEMQLPEAEKPFDGKVGRENPFVSY